VLTYSMLGQAAICIATLRSRSWKTSPAATNRFRSSAPKARPPGPRCGCSCRRAFSSGATRLPSRLVANPPFYATTRSPWSCRQLASWERLLAVFIILRRSCSAQFLASLLISAMGRKGRREKGERAGMGGEEVPPGDGPGPQPSSSFAGSVDPVESAVGGPH